MAKDKLEKKKKKIEEVEEEKKDKVKKQKKKMTSSEKRQVGMKITCWIMALIMIAGVVMTFLSFFAT